MSEFFNDLMKDYDAKKSTESSIVLLGYTETGNEVNLGMSEMGHTLISGMSRSGKSRMAKAMLHSIAEFAEVAIFTPKPSDYIEFNSKCFLSNDTDKFGALLRRVVGTMEKRSEKVYKNSVKSGKSVRCYDPPLVVVIDEFATFNEASGESSLRSLKRLISEGAGLNVFLLLITQVATKRILSDGLRDNMMTLIAFKARDAYASRMAIGNREAEFLELGQAIVRNVDKQFLINRY